MSAADSFIPGDATKAQGGFRVPMSSNQMPDHLPQPHSGSKSRKRATSGDNWLPPNWRVEDKVRTSGATAGTVDKYYYEPVTGRKFRSKTEVLYYLEHGTLKRSTKKAENPDVNPDLSGGQGSKKASRKAKDPPPEPFYFDFDNPPEKVSWSLAICGKEPWTPYIGDNKVQDSVRQNWNTAFEVVSSHNPSKLSF